MSKLSDKIGQFVTIPHTVVKMIPAIGAEATTLFVYLRYRTNSKTGDAFPSYDTIQAETGLTRRRVARALRVLMSVGLTDRKRRFGKSTIYTLTVPDKSISTPVVTNDKTAISNPVDTIISNPVDTIISNPVDTLLREKYQERNIKREKFSGKPPKGKPDELKIESVFLGSEIIAQLKIANSTLGRKSPSYFANPQQRDQFDAALRLLNGAGKALIVKGIAQRGTSLSTLGAWLEACAKNQTKSVDQKSTSSDESIRGRKVYQ